MCHQFAGSTVAKQASSPNAVGVEDGGDDDDEDDSYGPLPPPSVPKPPVDGDDLEDDDDAEEEEVVYHESLSNYFLRFGIERYRFFFIHSP